MNANKNKIEANRKLIVQLTKARKTAGNRAVWEEYGLAIKECKAEIRELQKLVNA